MGFIRYKTNIGVKMLGDKKANIVFGTHSPCSAALAPSIDCRPSCVAGQSEYGANDGVG